MTSHYDFYIGNYNTKMGHVDGKAKGVVLARLLSSGELTISADSVPQNVGTNPTYVHYSSSNQILYVVNECAEGRVAAYKETSSAGTLSLVSEQSSKGSDPCYIELFGSSAAGELLLVANYSSGSTVCFRVDSDGTLSEHGFYQHEFGGTGPNAARQEGAHAHMARGCGKGQERILVPDLGNDEGFSFQIQESSLTKIGAFRLNAGDGPRHLEFHPSRNFAYVVAELSCTVTVCRCDPSSGELTEKVQVVSTLPDGFENSDGSNTCAHMLIHPSGKFLYVSNRGGGDHSISLFLISEDGMKLDFVPQSGAPGTGELVPRAFNITPDGVWMVVAYQNSDKLISYKIDQNDGTMTMSHSLSTPTPVCISWRI